MKTFSLCIALIFCGSAFAAIEFSDDMNGDLPPADVAALEGPVVGSDTKSSSGPTITSLRGTDTMAGPEAQSSIVGQADGGNPRRPLDSRNPMMMGMMGGGGAGGTIGLENLEDNTDEFIPVGVDEPPAEVGDAEATSGGDSVTLPEPSTAMVWTVLGICGIALARRWR